MFADMTDDREELGEDIWRRFTPRRGIDMPALGNARGESMQHGYAPEGGKRITPHHLGGLVQADMLSACMEYEDILSDKQRPTTYS